jgi:hypothetical protein
MGLFDFEKKYSGTCDVTSFTCVCEPSAPFCNLQSRVRTHAVLVIGLFELLGNPTTLIIFRIKQSQLYLTITSIQLHL